jgi:hypothetical protein
MKRFIIIISLLYSPFVLWAQNLQILNKSNSLLSDNINAIDVDENYLWAATKEGIYRINKNLKNPESKIFKATSAPVISIVSYPDKILIGLKDKGLYTMDKTTLEFNSVFKSKFGKNSIELIKSSKSTIAKNNKLFYYIDIYKDSLLEINELDSKINKTVSDNFKWKDDTLFIHKLAYLNYAEKNIELLSENEKYSLLNIENEKFLFVKEFKCLFPIKLDTSYSIKQYELLNDNLLMVCNKGLLVMNIPAQKFTKPLSKVSITSINNKIYDKTKPYLVPKKSILKLKFHTENLGAENELLIGKSLDRLTYTWEKFSIKEIVANNNENPIYFKVKNIRGDESEIIELNLDIKSDFNLNIINLILALILVLVYTFAIIWFITNKKNKEIRLLEGDIINKTKEIQELKKKIT